jgi:hypothetical protein
MNRHFWRRAAWAILAVTLCSGLVSPAMAGRWGRNRQAPTQARTRTQTQSPTQAKSNAAAPGPTGIGNGYNAGNNAQGWNRNNTWYNIPQYGNYAPPPYATSKKAFIQVGPLPAFGGVRSLPGWGGAR